MEVWSLKLACQWRIVINGELRLGGTLIETLGSVIFRGVARALIGSLTFLVFQTTAPKSCYMRPPSAMLTPRESIIATVFKFVEPPEESEKQDKKSKDKFKIVSMKIKEGMEFTVELFDEQRDAVSVEQILKVIFLDPDAPCRELEKLKNQLADAEAAAEARKKPPPAEEDTAAPRQVGEGLVIDEWKERRERYLAQQQGEAGDSGDEFKGSAVK
ncbi:hypothetical protein AMTR_s00006p00053180 [Amborella trichopoda]|uniref:MSP domain-containing protein n=1 Tax=Amborella trichopoda TaxID=13333 RepID=W1P6V2_AMBTC|nr:hypothetical protein AMTR_s00006p00053180 [Amborella trichopoda]